MSEGVEEGEEVRENVSEEGEVTQEEIKVVISEKWGITPYLYGEVIMESVGIPEEEVKLNTPVTAPHIITSSYSPPPFLSQV